MLPFTFGLAWGFEKVAASAFTTGIRLLTDKKAALN